MDYGEKPLQRREARTDATAALERGVERAKVRLQSATVSVALRWWFVVWHCDLIIDWALSW